MSKPRGPAYRIETPRLRLRCFAPADVDMLSLAIGESLAHLTPWHTWTVHEPLTRDDRLTWVRTQRGHFDLGSDYCFGAFDKDESSLLGVGVLRLMGSVDEREAGYWIHAQQLRRGLGSELLGALLRVSFELEDLDAVELRTLPDNEPSARLARRFGFSGPSLDPLSYPMPDGDKRDLHVYTLSRVEYASSPARSLEIQAFDALERRIL